jgi:hypothetical protein
MNLTLLRSCVLFGFVALVSSCGSSDGSGDISANCEKSCAASAPAKCSMASTCVKTCQDTAAAVPKCTSQINALLACEATHPAADWECDADGQPALKTGCDPEGQAALTCVLGGGS